MTYTSQPSPAIVAPGVNEKDREQTGAADPAVGPAESLDRPIPVPPGTVAAAPPSPAAPPDVRVKALRRFALSITGFTIVGHLFLGFEQSPVTPIVTAVVAYALEILLETIDARVAGRRPRYLGDIRDTVNFLLPSHIAAMATALLLWGSSVLWPYLMAVSIAITVKHLIKAPVKGRWRHTMNPSNTGIAVTLIVFPWVGIAPPYMFTASVVQPLDTLIPVAIVMLGTMLNVKLTGKWPLILGWVAGFIAQAVIRSLVLDADLLAALAPLTGVAFVLFTNYMITDPGSTPSSRRNQVGFGLTCAAVYGLLVALHVSFGLFFALVITCTLRTLLLHGTAMSVRLRPADRAVASPAGGKTTVTSGQA